MRILGINALCREEFLETDGSYDHWHAFLLTEGSFEADGETMLAGDLYFFAPHKPFSRRVLHPICFLSIHFADDCGIPICGRVRFREVARVLSTAELLKKSLPLEGRELYIRHLWEDLLLQYELEQKHAASRGGMVEAALAICEQRPLIGIGELAAELHISKTYLIRLFRRELGKTPGEYLKGKRVEIAKALLLNSVHSMQRIAELCGYANAYYFSTDFKKQTGHSPTAYRRIWRA